MKSRALLSLIYLAVTLLFAKTPVNGDGNWPREIDIGSTHLVIYQP